MKVERAYERFENIIYTQNIADSGDLESATKTITATSEPVTADYMKSLTITAPSDPRLEIMRICVRLEVTIDSFAGGGTTLNYRIKRDGTSIGTGTLATGGSTGAKQVCHEVTTGTLTGAATYEVFLWVDSGSCTISVCRIYVGVGTTNATGNFTINCLRLNFKGWVSIGLFGNRIGTGSFMLSIVKNDESGLEYLVVNSSSSSTPTQYHGTSILLSSGITNMGIRSMTVANDLCCITKVMIELSRVR